MDANIDFNEESPGNDGEYDYESSNLLEDTSMKAMEISEEHEENSLLERTTDNTASNQHPPGIFTDRKGNLRFVNLVVHYPCCIFFVFLLAAIGMSILLVIIVFQAGNPFADPGSEYDIKDIRSTAYDSFRLAQELIKDERDNSRRMEESQLVEDEFRTQEKNLDVTYWVYESETENGVFSSPESISAMKESLDLFIKHEDYENYCWKSYVYAPTINITTSQCHLPLSPLQMYYASYWDVAKAENVIEQLTDSDNVELYNSLSLCLEYSSYCELVPEDLLTDENEKWYEAINDNITSILMKLDGTGELHNININQMTLFAAYVMKLDTKRGYFDFFYDKHFSVDNPVSMYSRAMINWGSPLNVTGKKSDDGDEKKLKE